MAILSHETITRKIMQKMLRKNRNNKTGSKNAYWQDNCYMYPSLLWKRMSTDKKRKVSKSLKPRVSF